MILDKLDPGVTASYSPEFQKAFEAIAGLTPESPLGRRRPYLRQRHGIRCRSALR